MPYGRAAVGPTLVVLLVTGGCAAPRYFDDVRPLRGLEAALDAPDAERVRDLPMYAGPSGRAMDWGDLLAAAEWADILIIGEQHDDAIGHALQRAVVADVSRRWPGSALSMEMLERDEQALADDYLEGIIDASQFARLTHSTNWGGAGKWEEWYQPIVDAAQENGASVIAANAPRRYVRLARRRGYDRLRAMPAERRAWVAFPGDRHPAYRERFKAIMQAMRAAPAEGDAPDADDDASVTEVTADGAEIPVDNVAEEIAQTTADATDDTSEEAIDEPAAAPDPGPGTGTGTATEPDDASDDAEPVDDDRAETDGEDEVDDTAHPDITDEEVDEIFRSQLLWDATMADSIVRARKGGARKVVHLVGQFHSDFDGGTVREVRRRMPDARVLVISMQRAWPGELREEDRGRADVVVYTGERPPPEEDDEPEMTTETETETDTDDADDDADPDDADGTVAAPDPAEATVTDPGADDDQPDGTDPDTSGGATTQPS